MLLVMPVWREQLSATEWAYLQITDRSNREMPRAFLAPDGLDVTRYRTAFPQWEIRQFPREHFASIRTYSLWLTSPEFYRSFSDWEFITICQTDAVLIQSASDLLPTMTNYDLLGAQWMPPVRALVLGSKVSVASAYNGPRDPLFARLFGRRIRVGNGGLTARRTDALISVAERLVSRFPLVVREHINEDVLICSQGPKWGLRIAPPAVASNFLQETEVVSAVEIPAVVGFHALERWNPGLSRRLIAKFSQTSAS
mgnify:CR=1 FL=1